MNLRSRLLNLLAYGCIVVSALATCLSRGSFAGTGILDISINSNTVGLYEKFEVTFRLSSTYDNPFDPNEVDVRGLFITPSGETLTVPGFYYQDFTRRLDDNDYEQFDPQGDPVWKIRFAPQKIGRYSYHIEVADSSGTSRSGTFYFDAIMSDSQGFVRISSPTSDFFRFDSGEFFMPLGQNIAWTWTAVQDRGTYDYQKYMQRMQSNQENALRMPMVPENAALEWVPYPYNYGVWLYYSGVVGEYNMAGAWKLDYLIDLAREKDIWIVLCFSQTRDLRVHSTTESVDWRSNPYNAANGGPLTSPRQFFSSGEARDFYERRLRYIIARWGYSTNVLAWQLFNEIDWLILSEHYSSMDVENVISWHREMAEYIAQIDAFDHLITTSTASPVRWWPSDSWFFRLWELSELDIVDQHLYNFPDFEDNTVQNIRNTLNALRANLSKPCCIWEWGLDVEGDLDRADTHGIGIHNALWASTMSRSSALPWYWEHIDSNGLYHHFNALAKYLVGEDLEAEAFKEADLEVNNSTLEALGLSNGSKFLLWVHDKRSVHKNPYPPTVTGGSIGVIGMRDAHYQIEIWDTYDGTILESRSSVCSGGMLTINLPDFKRDIAVKAITYRVFLPYVTKQHR